MIDRRHASRAAALWLLLALTPLGAAGVLAAAASPSGTQRATEAGRSLIGTPAPPLVMTTIDGQRIELGRLYGHQAVYLKFWATWCVPCREQMPHLECTFRSAGPDLAVIAINAGFNDTLEDVRAYRRDMHLSVPIVLDDGRLGEAFNLAFLSPWCESYLASGRPRLAADCRAAREQIAARAARPAVRWLGVASGLWASSEDLAGYRDQYHVTIPLTLDESGRLFREFRVSRVPTLLLIDGSGRLVRRIGGDAAGSPQALATLLADTP